MLMNAEKNNAKSQSREGAKGSAFGAGSLFAPSRLGAFAFVFRESEALSPLERI